MNWKQLLSVERLSGDGEERGAARTPFQRDYDRVLYSSAFRRLGDKTQVFPVPLDDHIHSRLTHSLEVATIGRSLGTRAGRGIAETPGLPAGLDARDVGDCVAAACLAHDLGNPPFGHVGENAFQEFFEGFFERHAGAVWACELNPAQRGDLLQFEGNAQSLRIATMLGRPLPGRGLDLTCATLGALMKYPCSSTSAEGKGATRRSRSKHGIHQSELPAFRRVAERTGMPGQADDAWRRHPLAFLTEAADDIAYHLIDFEDGLRLGLIDRDTFVDVLRPLCEGEPGCPSPLVPDKDRAGMFDLALTLRGLAIGRLIREAAEAFAKALEPILSGEFDEALLDHVASREHVKRIGKVNFERCYQARDVLKMELSGAVAIEGVLDALTDAVVAPRSLRAKHLILLLPGVLRGPDLYTKLLHVTDHVSGMTDNYLLRLYRELSGIRLPGGRD